MNKVRVTYHGEPIEVQALAPGEQVFWNGNLCSVASKIGTDGLVYLENVKTGALYNGFAGFCTTMSQAY